MHSLFAIFADEDVAPRPGRFAVQVIKKKLENIRRSKHILWSLWPTGESPRGLILLSLSFNALSRVVYIWKWKNDRGSLAEFISVLSFSREIEESYVC